MIDRPLSIAVVTTEYAPLAKVGGLADVASALSQEYARHGATVTVWMPAWRQVWESGADLSPVHLGRPLDVPLGREKVRVELLEMTDAATGLRLFLIDHPPSFGRFGIYTDPATGEAWDDSDRRLVLFQRAVLEGLMALDLRPDVLHLHDHQTGLIPVMLRTGSPFDPFFRRTGILFTIHNLGYQGLFPADVLELAGLPMNLFLPSGPLEFWGKVNMMKGGLLYSDRLTTVSPRYADEIQTSEEIGFGLEGVLRSRASDLTGILNGIDDRIWGPAIDPHIARRYDADHLEGKKENRRSLIEKMKLTAATDETPILGLISRLVDQKGFDLVSAQAAALIEAGFRIVVLGSGSRRYEVQMAALRDRHPGSFAWSRRFDEPLAHLIEAGSDFFLMPSKYEPCGLNQMISMRYGTIPIVRATGGLIDTVSPCDLERGEGTGFLFDDYTGEALMGAARLALSAWRQPEALAALRRRGMAQDFSWSRSARAYLRILKEIAENRVDEAAPATMA